MLQEAVDSSEECGTGGDTLCRPEVLLTGRSLELTLGTPWT